MHRIKCVLLVFALIVTMISVPYAYSQSTASDSQQKGLSNPPIGIGVPLAADTSATLKAGLSVIYFLDFFGRDVRKLPTGDEASRQGVAGKPILQLNHQFGKNNVFDSGTNRGVGMRLRGYLHFASPGRYILQALSNDGLEIVVDENLIISDPKQHSDQFSTKAVVEVQNSGWYPVAIDYFQRKGTAALKLFWTTPQSSEMQVIPAAAYTHLDK